ncbi:TetR/AcrR family transcriptional regulator [Spirosoma aerophilum]
METNKRNRAQTTERILIAFEQLVSDQGVEGLTLTRLAERALVSKVLLYRYFGNMEGLLAYYIQLGRVIPQYEPQQIEQIRPVQKKDLAGVWSASVLQIFENMRAKPAARALLKASIKENDPLADASNRSLDRELIKLVDQLSFVEGGDKEAISAVVLGGLSYLTILAQLDRPFVGLDLRNQADWQRVEQTIKLIYTALAKMAVDSPVIKMKEAQTSLGFTL